MLLAGILALATIQKATASVIATTYDNSCNVNNQLITEDTGFYAWDVRSWPTSRICFAQENSNSNSFALSTKWVSDGCVGVLQAVDEGLSGTDYVCYGDCTANSWTHTTACVGLSTTSYVAGYEYDLHGSLATGDDDDCSTCDDNFDGDI
ncbi:hypothetical protein VKS41_007848 [Umbelopsis sp. WA50703]|jgi:hypothetical protein